MRMVMGAENQIAWGGGVKVGGYCLALPFRAEKEVSRAQVFRNQRGAE